MCRRTSAHIYLTSLDLYNPFLVCPSGFFTGQCNMREVATPSLPTAQRSHFRDHGPDLRDKRTYTSFRAELSLSPTYCRHHQSSHPSSTRLLESSCAIKSWRDMPSANVSTTDMRLILATIMDDQDTGLQKRLCLLDSPAPITERPNVQAPTLLPPATQAIQTIQATCLGGVAENNPYLHSQTVG